MSLVITGAAGHLGRRVVELLLERGVGPLIATTRSPEKLADLAARGVAVRFADFDDPASLPAAFAGAERLLLVSTDTLAVPGQRVRQHEAAIAAAVQAGVKHIVYTSLPRPEATNPATLAEDHRRTEAAVVASGLGYTLLRNNLYADLLLMSLPRAAATGQLVTAAGSGGTAYVTREDCARAAAAALALAGTGSRTLDVTGPAALTPADLAALVTAQTGRPVEVVHLPAAVLEGGMVQAGLPPFLAAALSSFDASAAAGYLAGVSDTVVALTGAPPESVGSFLARHAAAFAG